MPFDLAFKAPWVLALLPLLLLLPRGRTQLWRLAALGLLLVALAQPTVGRPSHDIAVLVDVSDSVGSAALDVLKSLDTTQLPAQPVVYLFASDATEISDIEGPVPDFLEGGSTDLARALQVVAAAGVERALLISDGAESVGDALSALPPVAVDAIAVASRSNARLVDLIAPQQASPGETVEVVAVVETDVATVATIYPTAGAETLEPITATLAPGRSSVPFQIQVGDASTVRITASFEVGFIQPRSDDALAIELPVSESEPVLVIGDPAFADLLEAQGFDVVRGDVAIVVTPLRYSAIVLRESAGQFTPGQLDLLRSYVDNGGGLLMTGGPDSFGFGAWYRTPVEGALPVSTDLRTEVSLPLVALVIVLDRSQSMSTGSPSKIDLAREGAISVVELAYQDDLLGLIAFSDASAFEWVFELRPATDRGKQEMLASILNITTQGGTVLEPAYDQAIRTLAQTDAAVKHIIILSDGKPLRRSGTVRDHHAGGIRGHGIDRPQRKDHDVDHRYRPAGGPREARGNRLGGRGPLLPGLRREYAAANLHQRSANRDPVSAARGAVPPDHPQAPSAAPKHRPAAGRRLHCQHPQTGCRDPL